MVTFFDRLSRCICTCVGRYGCDRYYLHNKQLQFGERRQEIERRLDELDL